MKKIQQKNSEFNRKIQKNQSWFMDAKSNQYIGSFNQKMFIT